MTHFTRIFRVEGGPLAEAIKSITAERERIGVQYTNLGEQLDCEQIHTWPWTGRFAGATFAKGKEPSLADWRLSHRMWVPRKKTAVGIWLWNRIKKLEPLPAIQTVLEPYGLTVHKPQLEGSEPSYVEGFGHVGIYYVHVPWYTPSPLDVGMHKVLGDASQSPDFLFVTKWQVPVDWVEVQPFEKLLEWDELDRDTVI